MSASARCAPEPDRRLSARFGHRPNVWFPVGAPESGPAENPPNRSPYEVVCPVVARSTGRFRSGVPRMNVWSRKWRRASGTVQSGAKRISSRKPSTAAHAIPRRAWRDVSAEMYGEPHSWFVGRCPCDAMNAVCANQQIIAGTQVPLTFSVDPQACWPTRQQHPFIMGLVIGRIHRRKLTI
jgi:hypothetical protein